MRSGLAGLSFVLGQLAPLFLMCDPRDLGQTLGDVGDDDAPPRASGGAHAGFDPTIFLFDNVPGGVGLAERIHEHAGELLARAGHLIGNCTCAEGCPLCVGAASNEGSTRKRAALGMLSLLRDS